MNTDDLPEDSCRDSDRLDRLNAAANEWAKGLIDPTGRNRLIYYRDLKVGTLRLENADTDKLSELLQGKKVRLSGLFPVADDLDEDDTDESETGLFVKKQIGSQETEQNDPALDDAELFKKAIRSARNMASKARQYFEERGLRTLYLIVGLATWTTAQSSARPNAPVLMQPIKLQRRGAAASDYDLVSDGEWEINQALLHHLTQDFQISHDVLNKVQALLEETEADQISNPEVRDNIFSALTMAASSVPNFSIEDTALIGNFSYAKQPMVNDLLANINVLAENDLISAIAGDSCARKKVKPKEYQDLNPAIIDSIPPEDEYLILDADFSQNLAINTVIGGQSIVIQGPPGTGKSQTISNLISTAVARGKSVLFVAEKRAAIDAVTKHLNKAQLDDYVMDLHGARLSRKEVSSRLTEAYSAMRKTLAPDTENLSNKLTSTRKQINSNLEALHQKHEPWGFSFSEITSRLIGLKDYESYFKLPKAKLQTLDKNTQEQITEKLKEWSKLVTPIITGESVWADAKITKNSEALEVSELLENLRLDYLPKAQTAVDEVAEHTGIRASDLNSWIKLAEQTGQTNKVLDVVDEQILIEDISKEVIILETCTKNPFVSVISQLFRNEYREAKKKIIHYYKTEIRLSGKTLCALASQANKLRKEFEPKSFEYFDSHDEISLQLRNLKQALNKLAEFLPKANFFERSLLEIKNTIEELRKAENTLFRLPLIQELEDWLNDNSLTPLLALVYDKQISPTDVPSYFDRSWLRSVYNHLRQEDQILQSFEGYLQDESIRTFQALDTEHISKSAQRVIRSIAEYALDTRNKFPEQENLLQVQSKKKRGTLSVRELFEKAPDVLTSILPCWTMSPLAVSQTLPGKEIFDFVIFDEASQIVPAEAIPSLMRGRQAIIAGDSRQLPPTSFFEKSLESDRNDNEDEVSDISDFESILDITSVFLPSRRLTWHYRSQDERLIAFSNHNIYEGYLVTFPGSIGEECLNFEPIRHNPSIGNETRSNPDEISRVVELMIEHARLKPNETLGVITMGIYHADRIETALRQRLKQEQSDEELESFFDEGLEERVFVKSIETVQGDERDAIIISTGYRKNDQGRLRHNFGPINQEGGERRLNVAVTRARRRITLVSSFSHTDIDLSRASSPGAALLQSYLKYVDSGGTALKDVDVQRNLNAFEYDILTHLEKAGLDVIPQYGVSSYQVDFAVKHPTKPGEFVLAIEADGASYHTSYSARDRDRIRQEHLERLGWRVHRIWSTDWFRDPEKEIQKVLAEYEAALAAFDKQQNEDPDEDNNPDNDDEDDGPLVSVQPIGPNKPIGPSKSVALEEPGVSRQTLPQAPIARQVHLSDLGIEPGLHTHEYKHSDLVRLIKAILAEGRLLTDNELVDEAAKLLKRNRTKKFIEALKDAVRVANERSSS